jgi:hypothetical protein
MSCTLLGGLSWWGWYGFSGGGNPLGSLYMGGERRALPALPRERDPVHIVQEAGWVPGSVSTGAENLAPPGFDPPTVQSVRSLYTDWAIQAVIKIWQGKKCVQILSRHNLKGSSIWYTQSKWYDNIKTTLKEKCDNVGFHIIRDVGFGGGYISTSVIFWGIEKMEIVLLFYRFMLLLWSYFSLICAFCSVLSMLFSNWVVTAPSIRARCFNFSVRILCNLPSK